MKNFRQVLNKVFFVIGFSLLSSVSYADDIELAKTYINDFGNNIISIASDNKLSLDQKKQQLITLIENHVDTDWVSKFVLAKHYRSATDEQRERFRLLYREFMINTYAPKFKGYNGEKFVVKNDVSKQSSYYLVKCIFYPKESPPVNLDFRIRKKSEGSDFAILDIIAEGVSLIETQRSEFGSAISTSGLDKFLDDLEIRVKKLKTAPASDIIKTGKKTKATK